MIQGKRRRRDSRRGGTKWRGAGIPLLSMLSHRDVIKEQLRLPSYLYRVPAIMPSPPRWGGGLLTPWATGNFSLMLLLAKNLVIVTRKGPRTHIFTVEPFALLPPTTPRMIGGSLDARNPCPVCFSSWCRVGQSTDLWSHRVWESSHSCMLLKPCLAVPG